MNADDEKRLDEIREILTDDESYSTLNRDACKFLLSALDEARSIISVATSFSHELSSQLNLKIDKEILSKEDIGIRFKLESELDEARKEIEKLKKDIINKALAKLKEKG